MNDENKIKKLKKEITKLKNQIDEMGKKLKENMEADERRSQEIQKEHHKENLLWNKLSAFGALGTPLAMILSFAGLWLKNKKKKNTPSLGLLGEKEKIG